MSKHTNFLEHRERVAHVFEEWVDDTVEYRHEGQDGDGVKAVQSRDRNHHGANAQIHLTALVLEGGRHLTIDPPEWDKNKNVRSQSCDELDALYLFTGE